MRIDSTREQIATILRQPPESSDDRFDHLEQIRHMVEGLARAPAGSREMRQLIAAIRQALDALADEDS